MVRRGDGRLPRCLHESGASPLRGAGSLLHRQLAAVRPAKGCIRRPSPPPLPCFTRVIAGPRVCNAGVLSLFAPLFGGINPHSFIPPGGGRRSCALVRWAVTPQATHLRARHQQASTGERDRAVLPRGLDLGGYHPRSLWERRASFATSRNFGFGRPRHAIKPGDVLDANARTKSSGRTRARPQRPRRRQLARP
jgi:hypothetical protein